MTSLPREAKATLKVIEERVRSTDRTTQAVGRAYLLAYLWAYDDLNHIEQAVELEQIYDALCEDNLQPLQTTINELSTQQP